MRLWIIGLLLFCALRPLDVLACDPWAARVVAVNGLVVMDTYDPTAAAGVNPAGSAASAAAAATSGLQPVAIDTLVCPGQRLMTGANSRAALYLSNNTYLRLAQNSILILPRQARTDSFLIRLQQGVSHLISRITRRFEVATPFVNAAVEGTEFLVEAGADGSSISVIEGEVTAFHGRATGDKAVLAGQKLLAAAASSSLQASSSFQIVPIDKTETVDWAIYYPPLFTLGQLRDSGQQRWLDAAALQLRQGRPDLALAELDAARQASPAVIAARAAVLLSVGQVQQASAMLQALQSAPSLALQSIIHSATNRAEQAVLLAEQALALDARSVAALVALSYAQQAQLQLPAALAAARSATASDPDSALAWSRLSELELIAGASQRAEVAVARALALAPADPRALTQQAFLNLFNLQLERAAEQFRQAIELHSENPQAHLGLGLALLRQGELEAGRRQLEIATSLDPARSVLRSYLGRAYFEELRDAEAAVQWQLAKEFDPLDPTPWFYEGVRKLFANNPLGAITELQVSRKLNDQRALYRAETLLQSDAASRSATLARAYSDAGYQQGVRLAAWEALAKDPASAEGHRLLADTYRGERRYEAARVSELQQAQLLQPVSSYPLQLQLSETDLGLVEGLGPSRPGLNEYHALFNQNQWSLSSSGLVGGDGTLADEIVLSRLQGPVALSLGQYHYESDGFRDDAYQDQDIYSGFLQWQVTPQASVELEYRDLTLERGDQGLSIIAQGEELSRRLKTWRLGSYLQITPAHGVLLSAISQQLDDTVTVDAIQLSTALQQDPWIVELKYLGQFKGLKIQAGAGQYSADQTTESAFPHPFFPGEEIVSVSEQRKTHRNYYAYLETNITRALLLDAGLSYDRLELESAKDISQVSPKFGLAWQGDGWRWRGSVFRSFKRDLAASQTIEKSYVAGFNQIFADSNNTDSRNYAMAVDYSLSASLYAGLDFLRREVEFPGTRLDTMGQSETVTLDYTEEFGTLYLTRLFNESTSLTLSYEYQQGDFDYVQELGGVNEVSRSTTHIVPLSLRQSRGRYFSWQLVSRYVNQTNTLALLDLTTFLPMARDQREETWLFDFTLESKLPGRRGVFELGVKNLFDREVEIVDETAEFLRFYPGRFAYARLQLHFH